MVDRLAGVPLAYCAYLWKSTYPVELAVFYPHQAHPVWQRGLEALAALLAVSWLCFRARRQRPYLLIGWLWFVGTLVPVIGLVQVGGQAYADRYTYLPHIGLFIAIVWGADELITVAGRPRVLTWGTAIILVSASCLMTQKQLGYWKDSESLWKRTIEVTPANPMAWQNLGAFYAIEGPLRRALVCF